jgi:hypothetical protein
MLGAASHPFFRFRFGDGGELLEKPAPAPFLARSGRRPPRFAVMHNITFPRIGYRQNVLEYWL